MKVNGKEYRSLWFEDGKLLMIDQRKLPFEFSIFEARSVDDVAFAIKDMVIRGAPAIGCAAAYGIVLAEKNEIEVAFTKLANTRPTAHDLFYALEYMRRKIDEGEDPLDAAEKYVEQIIDKCRKIGEYGETLIQDGARILTHCNAGALATVDYGTALSPMRVAKKRGKKIFVYVDETRPRLQGSLTSWELKNEEIEHVVIPDNAAGYFMERGEVDMILVGADRIAMNGDFANKIGTYEKAVLAKENNISFYVAAPLSTFDRNLGRGEDIVIEERGENEIKRIRDMEIFPEWVKVKNPAFDVTPARYVTAFITEKGIIKPDEITEKLL
ncbi:MAG: S-methyl-5-thioribose-1-phosphate isomerase [Thermoplasmata archaeon]|nr:MAG: S-methyl-5-thioribose-1-phosphate isomerase [Thermoplasmata archaeon]KAA0017047.1 MAG: S-methyl-5-thioribose-1-phosphate isomerase [Thermoplasmata archaeon]